MIFIFFATRLRDALHGLLGGASILASKLAGGSSTRGTLGSLGRLNLDRSWNLSCSVSSSSLSDVSSTTTVLSPSPTSRCSFADFAALLRLALRLLWDFDKSGR
jgi:hypothetical protein